MKKCSVKPEEASEEGDVQDSVLCSGLTHRRRARGLCVVKKYAVVFPHSWIV